jgi:hypothetical protein
MEERDSARLVRRFKEALDHVHETGVLRPSDLQMPIFTSPQYYKQLFPGYDGGAFDPEKLGAAYVVVLDTTCKWNPCTWNLSQQVPTPPSPHDSPSALQQLHLDEHATARV